MGRATSLLFVAALAGILTAAPGATAFGQELAGTRTCWTSDKTSFTAVVENPAQNLTFLLQPRVFTSLCDDGEIVTNGTFFSGSEPLGVVISGGEVLYSPPAKRFKSGSRWIDLGMRWGIGVLKDSSSLAVSDSDSAPGTMRTFLGGGGLLLQDGEVAVAMNASPPDQWGASFSPSDILESRRGRTAFGLKTVDGRQELVVLSVKESAGATIAELAERMKSLGANDAVFYDGGGAAAFAAGGRCRELPSNPGEDLNPTHVVIKACR
jgi:exopolysaccharide biosynthesis protein